MNARQLEVSEKTAMIVIGSPLILALIAFVASVVIFGG